MLLVSIPHNSWLHWPTSPSARDSITMITGWWTVSLTNGVCPTGGEGAADWVSQVGGQPGGAGQSRGPAPPTQHRQPPGSCHANQSHLWLPTDRGKDLAGGQTDRHTHTRAHTRCENQLSTLLPLEAPPTCTKQGIVIGCFWYATNMMFIVLFIFYFF